jgi:hypothetical protein
MPTARHKATQQRSAPQQFDMNLVQQVVDALPKGSDELRKLRNAVWKKIAESDIPDEAISAARNMYEKFGKEIAQRAHSKVKKEYREKVDEETVD